MSYYIDLEKISLEEFKEMIRHSNLIPSWLILKDNLDKNFEVFHSHDIHNLAELKLIIKNKDLIHKFSVKTGLSEDYLNVMRRVINGYHPKPNKIKDFRGVPEEVVTKLKELGITNTRQLFPEIVTKSKRKTLLEKSGVAENDILNLTKLTDLSRIRWVGHTFAYVLVESGYDTSEKVAKADYKELYSTIIQLNKEREIYKGNIGENDMKLCVEAAGVLDHEVEY